MSESTDKPAPPSPAPRTHTGTAYAVWKVNSFAIYTSRAAAFAAAGLATDVVPVRVTVTEIKADAALAPKGQGPR